MDVTNSQSESEQQNEDRNHDANPDNTLHLNKNVMTTVTNSPNETEINITSNEEKVRHISHLFRN